MWSKSNFICGPDLFYILAALCQGDKPTVTDPWTFMTSVYYK